MGQEMQKRALEARRWALCRFVAVEAPLVYACSSPSHVSLRSCMLLGANESGSALLEGRSCAPRQCCRQRAAAAIENEGVCKRDRLHLCLYTHLLPSWAPVFAAMYLRLLQRRSIPQKIV